MAASRHFFIIKVRIRKSSSKNLEANLHPEAASSPEEAISEKEIKDSAENGLSTRDAVIVYSGKYVSGKNYDLFINLIGQVGDLKLEEPLVSLSQLGPENPYCALMDLFYNKISRGLFREAVNNFKERIDPLLPNLEKLLKDSDKISKENALVSAYSNIVKLSRRAEKIRERIITSNLRLVVSIAKKYHGQDLSDLINDGNTGLILAVDHYDHTIASFSTHASEWIEATIKKEILKSGRAHKLNHSLSKESSDLKRTIEHLSGRLERRPTDAEILSFLDWSASKMDEVRTYQKAQNPIYMDDSAGEEGDDTIGESFSDHQIFLGEKVLKRQKPMPYSFVSHSQNGNTSVSAEIFNSIPHERFHTLCSIRRITEKPNNGLTRKVLPACVRLFHPDIQLIFCSYTFYTDQEVFVSIDNQRRDAWIRERKQHGNKIVVANKKKCSGERQILQYFLHLEYCRGLGYWKLIKFGFRRKRRHMPY